MRIQHNIMAMNAYRNYSNNTSALSKNLEKLSSGYKINRAGDDAAGLAISEKMRAQITGLEVAQKNAKDGISLVQTAEGALTEVHDMLNRMVELANQSANGTYDNTTDRDNLQKEVDQLLEEIDRIADSSNFNGINLLDGTLGLNQEAFTIAGVDAQGAQAVTDVITTGMPTEGSTVGTDTILHTDSTEAAAGSITIDVSQLAMASKDTTTKGAVDITLNWGSGNKTFTITADNNGDTMTGADIATKLAAAINADNTNKGILVGTANNTGIIYAATDNGDGTITLESKYDGAGTALADGKPTANTADANLVANWSISSAVNGATGTLTGGQNIGTTTITAPTKASTGDFANTFLKLDMTKLKDGMVMDIAGEKYTFAVGADSTVDTTGAGVIDLTDLDLTQTADQTEAMNRITLATKDNATFTVGHDRNGNLTLAEKTDGAGASAVTDEAMLEKLSTLDGLKSLVSFSMPAKNVGTSVTIDPTKVKEGDVLSVGGKRFVFTNDTASVGAGEIGVKIDGTNTATNFQDALNSASFDAEVNGNTVTIYAASATEDAPVILGGGLTLQIGDTSDDFNQLNVSVQDMHADSLGINGLSISDQTSAQAAIDKIKTAINTVSSVRGTLGATQNRLDHTINNLSVMQENIQDAESTIRDTDVADEMMAYTKNNILIQSAQAMLAQANQVPQGVLQLLQ